MTLADLSKKVLHLRGIHWVVTRFGGTRLRSLSFDEKFKSGVWKFDTESPELVALVGKQSVKGHILVLGCGAAPIAKELHPDSYESLLGIDISAEAIAKASRQNSKKIRFEIGDMLGFQCPHPYDVILFSDSLYYVPSLFRKRLLRKLQKSLTPKGCIIVAIAQPERYVGILKMIRQGFEVQIDRQLEGEQRHVLVFR